MRKNPGGKKKVQGAPGDDLDESGGHKTGLAAHPGQVPDDDHDDDDGDDDDDDDDVGQVPVHVQAVAQLDLQAYITIFNGLVAKYFQSVERYS